MPGCVSVWRCRMVDASDSRNTYRGPRVMASNGRSRGSYSELSNDPGGNVMALHKHTRAQAARIRAARGKKAAKKRMPKRRERP